MSTMPNNYNWLKSQFEDVLAAHQNFGKALNEAGPLDRKTAHLIKLAGAAASHSQGGVNSHSKQAMAAGATKEEIYHALILLSSTIGFPSAAAAVSWAKETLEDQN